MDLLAPCRSCLQCLPFFHVSPPSSPRLAVAAAAAPSSSPLSLDASKATSTDPSQSSELLPCPNAAPILQEQDLCLPIKAEEEPQAAKYDKDEALENFEDKYPTATESEAVPVSGILIAPPVSSGVSSAPLPEDPEDNKTTTLPELPLQVPFINDITFLPSGFMPLQSPITPAPFGAGYSAGQYPPHDQIYQGQHLGHAHLHHGHENSQHGHEHSLHSHGNSQHEYEAPLPCPHLDDSQGIDELHKAHHHSHDSSFVGDAENAVTGHASLYDNHHDKIDDISPTFPLETSQSTPDFDLETKVGGESSAVSHTYEANVGGESSAVSHTNGASALLETYHSEPVVLSGDPHDDGNEAQNEILGISGSHPAARRRRRDHFRDQFKGVKQQIKQGGHHLKEEGSKHMLTIIDNMNKQAQQIEQSGSFFSVPRLNNN